MKITKMTVGFGNTCGPKFEPIKAYIEYTVEGEELDGDDEAALQTKTLMDLHDLCVEALLRLKGEEEAQKYQTEREAK